MHRLGTGGDGRYVYLRDNHPEISQGPHVNYQFDTATARVWHERFDAGDANAAQAHF